MATTKATTKVVKPDERVYQIAKDLRATGLLMSTVETILIRSVHEAIELLKAGEN